MKCGKYSSGAVGSISLVKKGKGINKWKSKPPGKNGYRDIVRMSGNKYCRNRLHLKARQTGAGGYLEYLEHQKSLTQGYMKSM